MMQLSNVQDGGTSGSINLADYIGFLQSNAVLPCIPGLKVIIDWDTAATNFVSDPNIPAATGSYLPIRPTLLVEELVGMPEMVQDVKLPYLSTIVERFTIPATTNGTAQSVTLQSAAFRGRYLKDMMIFNKTPTSTGFMTAKQSSPAMLSETIQLVVNGRKYLPDQGINQEAMKLQYFNETYGPLNLPQFAYLPGLVDSAGAVLDGVSESLLSNMSVTGVSIEDNINRLDIEYKRTGNGTGVQIAQFNLLVFGRVARLLELSNGKIRLSY
jgi:hypothetical protein